MVSSVECNAEDNTGSKKVLCSEYIESLMTSLIDIHGIVDEIGI